MNYQNIFPQAVFAKAFILAKNKNKKSLPEYCKIEQYKKIVLGI